MTVKCVKKRQKLWMHKEQHWDECGMGNCDMCEWNVAETFHTKRTTLWWMWHKL